MEVLAALGRPDAALAVLRARAHVSHADNLSSEATFREAQTALAVRLECGVFTEACSEVALQPSGSRSHLLIIDLLIMLSPGHPQA